MSILFGKRLEPHVIAIDEQNLSSKLYSWLSKSFSLKLSVVHLQERLGENIEGIWLQVDSIASSSWGRATLLCCHKNAEKAIGKG